MKSEHSMVEVVASPYFVRRIKRLVKNYRSLDADLAGLIGHLEAEPATGTTLGDNLYKIKNGRGLKRQWKARGFSSHHVPGH